MVSESSTMEANKVVTGRFMEEFKNQHIFAERRRTKQSRCDWSPWRTSVLARKPDVDCQSLQQSWEGYVDHGQLIMRGFVVIFESGARGLQAAAIACLAVLSIEASARHARQAADQPIGR
jgi:hypothetical protein